jgi:hypothetical protein
MSSWVRSSVLASYFSSPRVGFSPGALFASASVLTLSLGSLFWFSVWIVAGTHPGCILEPPEQKARVFLFRIALS